MVTPVLQRVPVRNRNLFQCAAIREAPKRQTPPMHGGLLPLLLPTSYSVEGERMCGETARALRSKGADGMPGASAEARILAAAAVLADDCDAMSFGGAASYIYNPFRYARAGYAAYIERYATGP